jgi:hypothetical protein
MRLVDFKKLISDIFVSSSEEKKTWLAPLAVFLVVIAALLLLGAAISHLAPFIYPLL